MKDALGDLLDLVGEPRARRLLLEVGTRTAQMELERVISLRLAARLLQAREERAIVRDRLIARGHSERTAYRVLVAASDAVDRLSANEGPSLAERQATLESDPTPRGPHR